MYLRGLSGGGRPDRALPLDLRLKAISESIPASSIDELWVFPPLPNRDIACEFIVLLCYDGGEDRRRILTSHVDARPVEPEGEELEWVQRLREHGTAPHGWAAEIPDRLLQRLSDAGLPDVIEVGGEAEKWEEAIARFGNGHGKGAGAGTGNGAAAALGNGLGIVDSGVMREISFRTVIEASFPSKGDHSEADS
jgi:hypothetical protein